MKTPSLLNTRGASAIIAVLFVITILVTFAGSALFYASNKRLTINEACNWQESLAIAEAGANSAVGSIVASASGTLMESNTTWYPKTVTGTTMAISHVGGGVTSGTAAYSITQFTSSKTSRPYYKVRSVGIVRIPGSKSISLDSADSITRKLNVGEYVTSLNGVQITGSSVRTSTRAVEVWLIPTLTNNAAIATVNGINLNNNNLTVDAFNSTDPTRYSGTNTYGVGLSGTTGQFTAAMNPPIYDANLASDGGLVSVNNATVYGDVMTGVTGTSSGVSNVMGSVRSGYDGSFPMYTGSSTGATSVGGGNGINSATTLRGGTQSAPARYITSKVTLAGNSDILTFDFGQHGNNGANDPTMNYVELYVSGDFTTKGSGSTNGSVYIVNGMHVTLYIAGNMSLSGNSLNNTSQSATNLTVYGTSSSQTLDFGGTTNFYGSVYAPGATVTDSGSATFTGSIVAGYANLKGNTTFIYDAALATSAVITGFKPVAWFEDTGTTRNSL